MQDDLTKPENASSDQGPPLAEKPIMVYDGACDFCRYWVNKWQQATLNEVTYVPYQKVPKLYYGVTRQQFSRSVYLITKYRRLRGAAAIFEVLALGGNNFWNNVYYNLVLADVVFETGYQVIASNRGFFFWLTKIFYKDARKFDSQLGFPESS